MRKSVFILASFAVIALLVNPAFAQFAKVGTTGLKFLDIGVGARGLALGESYVAIADDASALFWNPSGIAQVENGEVFAAYTSWPADLHLYSGGLVYKLSNLGHIGLSFSTLTTGEMNITTVENPDGNMGTFTTNDWAFGVSYAKFLTAQFSVGVTFKYVREELMTDYDVSGWAADIGTYYDTGWRSVRIGMSIMNFGPDLRYEVDNDQDGKTSEDKIDGDDNDNDGLVDEDPDEAALPLPLSFRTGVAMDVFDQGVNKVTVLAEMMHPSDNEEQYHFGGEYWYNDMVALRTGYKFNVDEGGFTAGAGIRLTSEGLGSVVFDYAFTDFGRLDNVHRGSFSIVF